MTDEIIMRRCLELAQCGFPAVLPNPMVGAVIVTDNQVLAEGYHHYFGGVHAEIDALSRIRDKELLKKSKLYVNLEPCSHWGKTPPCAVKIVESGIPEVVIAGQDPNPLVDGNGIKILQDNHIRVRIGICEEEAVLLNKRFYTFYIRQRPYIILKIAETHDGFIARSDYSSKWISNELSRLIVHKWRGEEMAIMVGKNTVLYDNPLLTNRISDLPQPVRVLFDGNLNVPQSSKIFNNDSKTFIYNYIKEDEKGNIYWIKLDEKNDFLTEIMYDLYQRNIQSLIVEGGAKTINGFLTRNLWDEARIFVSNKMFYEGIKSPEIKGILAEEIKIKKDKLQIIYNPASEMFRK